MGVGFSPVCSGVKDGAIVRPCVAHTGKIEPLFVSEPTAFFGASDFLVQKIPKYTGEDTGRKPLLYKIYIYIYIAI